MPLNANLAVLDFSPLAEIGKTIGETISKRRENKRIQDAWAASGGDYNKMVQNLYTAGDIKSAALAAKIRDLQTNGDERFSITPQFDAAGNAYFPGSHGSLRKSEIPLEQPRLWIQTPQGAYERGKYGGNYGGNTGSPNDNLQPNELPVYPSPEAASENQQPAPNNQGYIGKDYTTPEKQKQVGDVQGKAIGALPSALAMKNRVIGAITSLEQDPDHMMGTMTGAATGLLPNYTNAANKFQSKVDQAIGGTFTSAYESLRGAQAITDIEGEKATAAITRLHSMRVGEPGYRDALRDAKYEVFNLYNIVREKAGLKPETNPFPAPQTSPETGATGGRQIYDIEGNPL